MQQSAARRPPVPRLHQEAIAAVLDLQRDAARARRDDRPPLAQGLGHLDLEALADRELQHGVRVGQQHVEELVVGLQAHDGDEGHEVGLVLFEVRDRGVVDGGAVGVVDGAVAYAAQWVSVLGGRVRLLVGLDRNT